MKGNAWAIARKELARFFSNNASALASIVLPGLLIFLMWTFMGDAMDMTLLNTRMSSRSGTMDTTSMPATSRSSATS